MNTEAPSEPARSARERLFGAATPCYSGRGATVLLLGTDLPAGPHLGGRLRDLDGASCPGPGPSHALRVALICAGGFEDAPEAPLGIAPEARVLHASYAGKSAEDLDDLVRQCAPHAPDVVGLAWSAPEDLWLATHGRSVVARWADTADHAVATLAAAGHDGPDRIRFPASCEHVLAIGMCDEAGAPTPHCGTSPAQRKPELLVPSGRYATRDESGLPAALSGTSAAVAIATGCAALWIERLRAVGLDPSPAMVRAALLAGAEPSSRGPHRVLVGAPFCAPGSLTALPLTAARTLRCRLRADGSPVRVAVALRARRRPERWVPQLPVVTVEAAMAGSVAVRATGAHWVALDLDAVPTSAEITLTIEIEGAAQGGALVALGAACLFASTEQEPEVHAGGRLLRRSAPTIVALSASHDASACVLRDGRVEVALLLERLTRKKHDGVPFLASEEAARYCLESLGLEPEQIDCFAFNAQPLLPGWVGLAQPVAEARFTLFDPYSERALHVSHHLAHAYAAFGASGFDAATVLVCDGSGGSVVGADDHALFGPALREYLLTPLRRRPGLHVASAYRFDRRGYRLLWREAADSFNVRCGSSSIGETYAAVANYVFGSWQASGKLMGLAPYGNAEAYGPSLLVRDVEGRLQFRADWKLRESRALDPGAPLEHRDLAARIQADFEVAMLDRVRAALRDDPARPLVLTGGLALNCRANQRVAEELGPGRTFFFPASHDGGVAIGAALAAHAALTGVLPERPLCHDFLGHRWSIDDVEIAIRARAERLERRPCSLDAIAEALARGEVIGWFEGGAEFGPRALGHRSILADPRRRATWDRINAEVKFREDFRPFAPMVPVEEAARFFEISEPSPFMLRVMKVREEHRPLLGAVCHVDGTARVQTVDAETLPRIHELLRRFGARTGLPVLLNTSLNRRGEPLVEAPLEAIDLLLATRLDALAIGDALLYAVQAPDHELALDDCLMLAPGVTALARLVHGGRALALEDRFRGTLALPPWFADLLDPLARGAPLEELLGVAPREPGPTAASALLTALYRERYLNLRARGRG